jgi:hypothetical protein
MFLIDHANVAPMQRNFLIRDFTQIAFVKQCRNVAGSLGQLDEFEQRAFTGTEISGDEQHFAGIHRERNIWQCVIPARVLLADVVEAEDGHAWNIAESDHTKNCRGALTTQRLPGHRRLLQRHGDSVGGAK